MTAPPSAPELSPAALAALQRGDKIAAIKIVRAETGLGLKEAKDLVDARDRTGGSGRLRPPVSHGDPSSARTWLLVVGAIVALAICFVIFRR